MKTIRSRVRPQVKSMDNVKKALLGRLREGLLSKEERGEQVEILLGFSNG